MGRPREPVAGAVPSRAPKTGQSGPPLGGVREFHPSLFWPRDKQTQLLHELGLMGADGDSGCYAAHRVIVRAVAERRRDLGRDELLALRRCWRVEAAKADLVGLWEAIDNNAGQGEFALQYDRWERASEAAARDAVAAWDADR